MNKSESIGALSWALSKAQAEFESVEKNATNPFLKSKYADIQSILETVRGPLAKYDLAVIQMPFKSDDGQGIGVKTLLTHKSGEFIESTGCALPMKADKGGFTAQTAGSCLTYSRRYELMAILGLSSVDDDGAAASKAKTEQKSFADKALHQRRVKMIDAFKTINIPADVVLAKVGASVLNDVTSKQIDELINDFEAVKGDETLASLLFPQLQGAE